jgi:hypothetical protein
LAPSSSACSVRSRVYAPQPLISASHILTTFLALDLVALYPKFLWEQPSAPLHFLVSLRNLYVSLSSDPFFASSTHEPWFEAFLYIEALAQFPLAVFLVSRLASSSTASSGRTELAALAFGCLTGMGSVVCCFHLVQLGEDVVPAEKKAMLLFGEYLPFAVIREYSLDKISKKKKKKKKTKQK